LVVRALGKIAESYKVDKSCIHKFDLHGAIVFDQRILSYKAADTISILMLEGRLQIGIKYGDIENLIIIELEVKQI